MENSVIGLTLKLTLIVIVACACNMGSANENVVVDKIKPVGSPSTSRNDLPGSNTTPEPTPAASNVTNVVCSDPAKPCHHPQKHFDDWELSFKMPAKLKPNSQYRSGPFYAVIIKTYAIEDCDGGEFLQAAEIERKREQANRKGRKVFASYECPNMGAVNYEFDGKWDAKKENIVIGNFVAIYAGTTKSEGEQILDSVKPSYPQAQLKEMKTTFEVIEQ